MKEKLSSLINGTYVKDNPGLLEHPVCNIIIDFSRVSKVDSTALDKIKEVCLNYLLRNVLRKLEVLCSIISSMIRFKDGLLTGTRCIVFNVH